MATKKQEKQEKKISEKAYLDLKRTNEKYKALIIILSVLSLILIMLCVLFYFSEKNGPTFGGSENNTQSDVVDTDVADNDVADTVVSNKFALTSDNQTVTLGSTDLNLRVSLESNGESTNNTLYINDNSVASLAYDSIEASLVGDYVFIEWPGAQSGSLALGYIDAAGFYYPIDGNGTLIYNVYSQNGGLYAFIEDYSTGEYNTKVVGIALNGNDVSIFE